VPEDRHPGSSEASHDGADLAQVTEALLTPGEIEAGECPDTAAARLQADRLMVEAILEQGPSGPEALLTPGEIEAGECPDTAAARLQADRLMVEAILEQGLGGSRHQELEDELIKYAVSVLHQALSEGWIISMCVKLRRWRKDSPTWLDFTEAECKEFARQMVADAMPVFTKAVFVTRKWSADRTDGPPASLKTYFVNACAMQFPRLYREWLKKRREQPAGLQLDLGGAGAVRDITVAVDLHEEALGLLKSISDQQIREYLAWRAIGYTAKEAARLVGLTEKAAEGRLGRIRKTLKKSGLIRQPRYRPRSIRGAR
jgi:hypothetical protein